MNEPALSKAVRLRLREETIDLALDTIRKAILDYRADLNAYAEERAAASAVIQESERLPKTLGLSAAERKAVRAVVGQCVYRRGDDALQCCICGRHWPSSRGAVHTEDCAVPRLKALVGEKDASEPREDG